MVKNTTEFFESTLTGVWQFGECVMWAVLSSQHESSCRDKGGNKNKGQNAEKYNLLLKSHDSQNVKIPLKWTK
jgi:hypothetical protein